MSMIKEFFEYQTNVKGLSSGTVQEYGKDLKEWVTWARRRGLTWSSTTKHDVDEWTRSMVGAGLMPRTIKRRVSTLRGVYRWACHEGILENNPALYCQTPKAEERLPEVVEIDKVDEYLMSGEDGRAGEPHGAVGMKMLVAMLIETGCRINEALGMRWEEIDSSRRRVLVMGKGGRNRYVYFGERVERELAKHSERHGRIWHWDDWEARHLMYETLGKYVAGVHPHLLRHTFATKMVEQGMPLMTLRTLLGHKSVETTQIYTHVAESTLGADYNNYKF